MLDASYKWCCGTNFDVDTAILLLLFFALKSSSNPGGGKPSFRKETNTRKKAVPDAQSFTYIYIYIHSHLIFPKMMFERMAFLNFDI